MANTLRVGKRAILLIHGIGQQDPFETIGRFAKGLIQLYKKLGIELEAQHEVAANYRVTDDANWSGSFLRLRPKGSADEFIDLFEYYWAHKTPGKISFPEIKNWLLTALDGNIREFRERPELVQLAQGNERAIALRLKGMKRFLRVGFTLGSIADFLARRFRWAEGLVDWVERKASSVAVQFAGQVAIYTSTDPKSPHYQLREQILQGAENLLLTIIADNHYDEVIVAGHSLGSVIAYDALNRLNVAAAFPSGVPNLGKVKGLATFGSPLDKIILFFSERARDDQDIRAGILASLYSFKAKRFALRPNEIPVAGIGDRMSAVKWVNYYGKDDLISGDLVMYAGLKNKLLTLPSGLFEAHTAYWSDPVFYDWIGEDFLG